MSHSSATKHECITYGRETLMRYTHQWFVPRCCWLPPDLNELKSCNTEAKKSHISKGVIGLRSTIDKNDTAVKQLENSVNLLVRRHLDAWAIEFGYASDAQLSEVTEAKNTTLNNYNENQKILSNLNKNLGHRVAGSVALVNDEKALTLGFNLLKIIHLLKRHETLLNQGLIKSEFLKYTISLYRELGQTKYGGIIKRFTTELDNINQKIHGALDKLPAGIIGPQPVKTLLTEKLNALPSGSNPQVELIHAFEQVSTTFFEVNTACSIELAKICEPIEKEHGIMSIVPAHKTDDPFV